MARRRGLLAELQRQAAIQAREQQRAQATYARQHAAAVREAERAHRAAVRAAEQASRADARAAAEAEKRRKQAYLEARQAEVAAKNAALQASITELDQLLRDTLCRDDHIDLQTLKRKPQHPPFNPGADAKPLPAPQQPRYQAEPQWTQFAPVKPTGLAKAFGARGRYERDVSAATERFQAAHASWQYEHLQLRQQFKAAVADHHRRDQQRLQRLSLDPQMNRAGDRRVNKESAS